MSKLELLELIALAIIVTVLVIYWLIQAIKNHWIKELTKTVNDAIKYAEEHWSAGPYKKNYVMKQVEEKCTELGIPYFLIYKLINKLVDKIVSNYNIIKKG